MISSANAEIEAINKFVLYNSKATQLWVALYEQKRMKWDSERKEFKWSNGRSVPYPDHLKDNMPQQLGCWPSQREIRCNQSLPACWRGCTKHRDWVQQLGNNLFNLYVHLKLNNAPLKCNYIYISYFNCWVIIRHMTLKFS